jgi:pyrroline-5-carboxylate reductase
MLSSCSKEAIHVGNKFSSLFLPANPAYTFVKATVVARDFDGHLIRRILDQPFERLSSSIIRFEHFHIMLRWTKSSSRTVGSFLQRTVVDKWGRVSATTSSMASTMSSSFPNARFLSVATGPAVFDKIAFIGTGTMAQAMIGPLIRNGQPQEQVSIYDVSTKAMKVVQKKFPTIQTAESIGDVVNGADMIVLAVKPQNVNEAFWEQFPKNGSPYHLRDDATLLSICAGVPLQAYMPSGVQKIVRSMPNTPSTISQGMTVWCCTSNLTTQERDVVSRLLHSFGKAIYVDDEKFVDMSTSISGSGPAYIFMLMEAMIDAGVHMGFPRETATTLVNHTLLGM